MPEINRNEDRIQRRFERFQKKIAEEYRSEKELLRARPDYLPAYDYFLWAAGEPFEAKKLRERTNRPLAGLFCIQAPLELFLAFDLHPVRLCGGYQTAQQVTASGLPVLMCPMLKSFMGNFPLYHNSFQDFQVIVLPTTCDWVVKLPEIMEQDGESLHYLELPHVKDAEKSQRRWLEEIFGLKQRLEQIAGRKLNREKLTAAIGLVTEVWSRLEELNRLKSRGVLSSVWYMLMTNAFLRDSISVWLEKTAEAVRQLDVREKGAGGGAGVFMAGSPVIFPNFKMPELVERAGMQILADDLCSSERIVPGGVVYGDTSEAGMLRAIAERYHKACICPTFIDNDRRINNILRAAEDYQVRGVIYNLLKGCHPYDIEAISIERKLKKRGLKFIKIETDYGREDSQNILTRLEAFRQTL